MRVSVVVVNHNRADLLADCLGSLLDQTFRDFETLVVDNGSSDASLAVIEEVASRDSRVRLLPLDSNLGFAGGCNEGIRATEAGLVALLNNDATARPGWLQQLVSAAEGDGERVGMWGSKILFAGTEVIDKCGHVIYLDGQNRGRGTGQHDTGQFDDAPETLYPDGCAALYRRELLEDTGGFDPTFFAYGDDADLGLRARWLGWDCRYVPGAVVEHHHSSTTGRFAPRKIYWVERNRLWVALKVLPWPLLLTSPVLTLNRWFWNLLAAVRGRGAAGQARRQESSAAVVSALLRAQWDGWAAAPEMLGKRRALMKRRRLSTGAMLKLLWRHRISARLLAGEDYPVPEVSKSHDPRPTTETRSHERR